MPHLLILGGGIVGAGIARDAALRGLTVTLIDKHTVGWGTSSRSSRMIHGGIRYLELGDIHLVHEALAERATLLRIAPKLVRPVPFLFVLDRGEYWQWFRVGAGVMVYRVLAGRHALGPHHPLTRAGLIRCEPLLANAPLVGGALYQDAHGDDLGLVRANIAAARIAGARIIEEAHATVRVHDSGAEATLPSGEVIRADILVLALGPWTDAVRADLPSPLAAAQLGRGDGRGAQPEAPSPLAAAQLGRGDGRGAQPEAPSPLAAAQLGRGDGRSGRAQLGRGDGRSGRAQLGRGDGRGGREQLGRGDGRSARPEARQVERAAPAASRDLIAATKGSHITFAAQRFPLRHAIALRHPADHRVMFCVPEPERGRVLVGTTDTETTESPDALTVGEADVNYLMRAVRHLFPALQLTAADIEERWSGLRPLLRQQGTPSGRTREHLIVREGRVITIAGGKLTTYRKMAEEAVDAAGEILGVPLPACVTATTAL